MLTVLSMLLALAAPAAEPKATEGVVLFGVWSNPGECNADNATPIDFAAAAARRSELNGSCVSIRGWWTARALYAERPPRRHCLLCEPADPSRWLGLYASDATNAAAPREKYVEVLGVFEECRALYEPGVIFVSGYCHDQDGPFLRVASVRRLPPPRR
ncbi:MAG TPA: hypothetical protein VD906_04905 [Caulobacteraceae bacterium]|nr:hypothetical protein [Caulobacteraceae bacterium]